MSQMLFMAADCELPVKDPPEDFHFEINLDEGKTYDGDADDGYWLSGFSDEYEHTDLEHCVEIGWFNCTPGRANHLIAYIRDALAKCDTVEIWKVWLDYFEYDERPYYKERTLSIEDLTADDIMNIANADLWAAKDGRFTDYCLVIYK